MDARKMLARLNPSTQHFEVGSGGIPEFTPSDIAHALGKVRAGIGRSIMCWVWWPGGADLDARGLLDAMQSLQLGEYMRRLRVLEAAQLAEHIAAEDADGTYGRMHGTLARARGEVEAAKASCWPRIGPQSLYLAIRKCVLAELRMPHLCATCAGRGSVQIEARVLVCSGCRGSGRQSISDRRRAEVLERSLATYQYAWQRPYEWLLNHCAQEEREAARQLGTRLGLTG